MQIKYPGNYTLEEVVALESWYRYIQRSKELPLGLTAKELFDDLVTIGNMIKTLLSKDKFQK